MYFMFFCLRTSILSTFKQHNIWRHKKRLTSFPQPCVVHSLYSLGCSWCCRHWRSITTSCEFAKLHISFKRRATRIYYLGRPRMLLQKLSILTFILFPKCMFSRQKRPVKATPLVPEYTFFSTDFDDFSGRVHTPRRYANIICSRVRRSTEIHKPCFEITSELWDVPVGRRHGRVGCAYYRLKNSANKTKDKRGRSACLRLLLFFVFFPAVLNYYF